MNTGGRGAAAAARLRLGGGVAAGGEHLGEQCEGSNGISTGHQHEDLRTQTQNLELRTQNSNSESLEL